MANQQTEWGYEEGRTVKVASSELVMPISKFKLTKCNGSVRINGIEVKHTPTAEELVNGY